MKRVIVLSALLAMFSFGLAAQELEKPEAPPAPKDAPPAPKEEPKKEDPRRKDRVSGESVRVIGPFFREADKDHDGKLSKEEFGNNDLFDKVDEDEDGSVTMQECARHVKEIGEEIKVRQKAAAEEEFKALDRDDDKKLTAEELGERKELIGLGDKDKDGALTLEEYLAAREAFAKSRAEKARENAQKKPEDVFKEMDKDGDGKLAGDEIPERLQKVVDKVDTDGDGAISADELKAYREKMGKDGPRKRPQRGDRKPGERGPRKRPGAEPPAPPPPPKEGDEKQ